MRPLLTQALPLLQIHIEMRTCAFMFSNSGIDMALYAGTAEQIQQWAGTQARLLLAEKVLPVCSPQLLAGRGVVTPEVLAVMPLLQQSTRPEAWKQWFDGQGVAAPHAMSGPRYELFRCRQRRQPVAWAWP